MGSSVLRRLVARDALTGFAAALTAAILRFEVDLTPGYDVLTIAFPILWVASLALGGGYDRRTLGQPGGEEYRGVGRGSVILLAMLAILALSLTLQLSRIFVGTAIVLAVLGSLLVRKIMRTWVARRRRQGLMGQRTIVVGRADAAAGVIRSIREDVDQGLVPVAVCASSLDGEWKPGLAHRGGGPRGRPH